MGIDCWNSLQSDVVESSRFLNIDCLELIAVGIAVVEFSVMWPSSLSPTPFIVVCLLRVELFILGVQVNNYIFCNLEIYWTKLDIATSWKTIFFFQFLTWELVEKRMTPSFFLIFIIFIINIKIINLTSFHSMFWLTYTIHCFYWGAY